MKKKDSLFVATISLIFSIFWLLFYISIESVRVSIIIFSIWIFVQLIGAIIFAIVLYKLLNLNRLRIFCIFTATWIVCPIILAHIQSIKPIEIFSSDLILIIAIFVAFAVTGYLFARLLERLATVKSRLIAFITLFGLFIFVNYFFSDFWLDNRENSKKPFNRIEPYPEKIWNGYKVAVFGIDGGDWNVIQPLVNKGVLPNIAKLMKQGVYANFITDLKYESPMLWASIFTGLTPPRHGITDWRHSFSYNRKARALWNILNGYGLKGWISNIPGTYPMEVIEHGGVSGFPLPTTFGNVSGWIVSNDDKTTEIFNQFKDKASKKTAKVIRPHAVNKANKDSFHTVTIPLNLSDQLATATLSATFAHRIFMRNYFFEKIYRIFFYAYYKNFDIEYRNYENQPNSEQSAIEFKINTTEGVKTLVLKENEWSDFESVKMGLNSGYLALFLARANQNTVEFYVSPLFKELSLLEVVYPEQLYDLNLPKPYLVEGIGFSTTAIYPFRFKQLYLHNLKILEKHHQMSEMLIKNRPWDFFISVYTIADRTQHVFWPLHEPDKYENPEAYQKFRHSHGDLVDSTMIAIDEHLGKLLNHCDDSTIVVITSDHGFLAKPATETSLALGDHRDKGIFLISGPDIKSSGKMIANVSIYDLVPTILYALGVPVANDFDGTVVKDIFLKKFVEQNTVKYITSYNLQNTMHQVKKINKNVEDQLKSLGYIK